MTSRKEIRRQLRAWYVARFPVLGRYLADPDTDFTDADLAWFRKPLTGMEIA